MITARRPPVRPMHRRSSHCRACLTDTSARAPVMRAAVASYYQPDSAPALVEDIARLHLAPLGELLIAQRRIL